MTDYLKPRVNKAIFYFYDFHDFSWGVWRLIDRDYKLTSDDYNHKFPHELENLPPITKTLHLFADVSGMIGNGGFHYMFESYLGWKALPCIQGLYEIGEYDTVQILLYSYANFKLITDNDGELIKQKHEQFEQLTSQEKTAEIQRYLSANIKDFAKMSASFSLTEYDYDKWESLFFKITYQTTQNIVEHIKANPNDYFTDEDGQPFDLNFTGIYSNPSNDTINYELPMKDGKPHGHFKIYKENSDEIAIEGEFEHGFLKSYTRVYLSPYDNSTTRNDYEFEHYQDTMLEVKTEYYKNSNQPKEQSRQFKYSLADRIGEQKEWYESGAIKSVIFYEEEDYRRFEEYYESGQLKSKRLSKRFDTIEKISYHENGQKSSEAFYDDKEQEHLTSWHEDGSISGYTVYDDKGNYIEHQTFYPNGTKQSEFIKDKGGEITYLNYWDKQGNQTLKDGTGVVEQDAYIEQGILRRRKFKKEFKNKLKHGLHLYIHPNGQIYNEECYENDKLIYRKYFDEQGNLTDEKRYDK